MCVDFFLFQFKKCEREEDGTVGEQLSLLPNERPTVYAHSTTETAVVRYSVSESAKLWNCFEKEFAKQLLQEFSKNDPKQNMEAM